jgi:hypothetical protein
VNSEAPSSNLKSLRAKKHFSSQAMKVWSDKIEHFSDDIPEKEKDDEVINAEECLLPRSPVLQDNVPTGHSDTTIISNGPRASQQKRGRQLSN